MSTDTDTAWRPVTNGSGERIYVPGHGFLAPDEAATVPDSAAVHELLGIGCLWTHDPAVPPPADTTSDQADAGTTDSADEKSAKPRTTTSRRAKRHGKED